jgi:O-antigen ligase
MAGHARWAPQDEVALGKTPVFIKICFGVFLTVSIVQTIPLPLSLIKFLSPKAYEIYAAIPQTGPTSPAIAGWRSLSFAPNLSVYELVKYACYALFAYLVFAHVRTRKEIQRITAVMILSGVFQAVYGLIEYLGGTGTIFGWKNIHDQGLAFGTFVNRNHFSGFLEMTLSIGMGYLLAKSDFFAPKRALSLREKILWIGQEQLQKTFLIWIGVALMGIGIFASRSRSGIIIFFAIFLLALMLFLSQSRKFGAGVAGHGRRRAVGFGVAGTLVAVVVTALTIVGREPIFQRFADEELKSLERPEQYKGTIKVIKDYPWAGTGLGTLAFSYQFFEKKSDGSVLTHAHNDYLEAAAESGIIGGAALIILAYGALGILFWRWLERRDNLAKGVALGCMAGIMAILIHSVSDFNLRIPSNALYFVTLYALGMKAVMIRGKRKGED